MSETLTKLTTTCYHCGDECKDEILEFESHQFCCFGCKNVYELLSKNNLCTYYDIENTPGITQRFPVSGHKFNYLDDEAVITKLISFKDNRITKVQFHIPTMHCSSCIWLLENLYKLNPAISSSRVNFLKKSLSVTFLHADTSLREIVELLTSLGYEPAIHLNDIETTIKKDESRKILYQIGVAGFCFGNIMLISFPEYFGLDSLTKATFSKLFGYLNMFLSIPVFLFSARDYFINAFKGLRKNFISIDVPLALGILVLFVRSSYEVISETGIGYFDTHAGLVFFLLIGKWFQQKTYDTLSFERDYKSYFPVAVSVMKDGKETTVPVTNLNIGDRIIIRNNELIPADSILLKGNAHIDFSFVTGESNPVDKVLGEMIYAGGKQAGSTIELEVCKKVSQSYLTQLWNNEYFSKEHKSRIQTFQQKVSKYFTIALLLTAVGSASWWFIFDPSLSLNAFTSVLIIACPCALALSSPFALGTAMRILGKYRFYVKSPETVEHIARINAIAFDKTGTITQPSESVINWQGNALSEQEKKWIVSVVKNSVHPLSKKIRSFFNEIQVPAATDFFEINGKGLEGQTEGHHIMVGSYSFLFPDAPAPFMSSAELATRVFIKIDNREVGYFNIRHTYRQGLKELISGFRKQYDMYLLSGDNENEKSRLGHLFGDEEELYFRQSPEDKMRFIEKLHRADKNVMMIGDGLNDAGALKAADVGISVSEDTSHFSPAADVIMDAAVFSQMDRFIRFSKNTLTVIHCSFVISLIYNIVGLSYAVQGTLSPLIAAVLMPLSSVTVIGFTTIATSIFAKKGGLK